jgi:hypothetical protein
VLFVLFDQVEFDVELVELDELLLFPEGMLTNSEMIFCKAGSSSPF